jgi:hypothetical protein
MEIDDEQSSNGGKGGRLRVGLLLDSYAQPRWVSRVVEEIQSSDFAEVALVVLNRSHAAASANGDRPSLPRRAWDNRERFLYALYTKLDERLFPLDPDAFAAADIEGLLRGCPVVEVEPVGGKFTDALTEEDVRRVLSYKLDVALRFGFRILKGAVLGCARHGVWSYHHGDAEVNRGAPPGFWEVMTGEPTTGAMLQVLTEELDNGRVLYRGWLQTSNKFSVRRNCNNYYWGAAGFVSRGLRELHERGRVACDDDAAEGVDVYRPYYNRLYKRPTNSEMLPLLRGLARGAARRAYEKAFARDRWALGYRFKSSPDDRNETFYKYKYLMPPPGRFWADPFPLKRDGAYFVFFEDAKLDPERGHISGVELTRTGARGEPFKVLERDYHLSYPFLFEWRGELFMLPETSANETVELYRCASFPNAWQQEKVLMEGVRLFDATLAEVEGRWWMFATSGPEGVTVPCDELHLFYADSPLGPWRPHRLNPVKTDGRGSRPAGALFRRGSNLYRPAQDCSKHYGYAMTINRVLRLSTDEYREEAVSKILPRWRKGLISTHTLNTCDELTVIDCQFRERKFF